MKSNDCPGVAHKISHKISLGYESFYFNSKLHMIQDNLQMVIKAVKRMIIMERLIRYLTRNLFVIGIFILVVNQIVIKDIL